jgi:hypothetical protein
MKVIGLTILVLLSLESCKTKTSSEFIKYNFKYKLDIDKGSNKINIYECTNNDYVKYGILSHLIIKDLKIIQNTAFYFETKKGTKDSLLYNKEEISIIKKDFSRNQSLIKSCEKIMKLSNEKILFYNKILYDIMIYDSQLNGIDTTYYALNDISITSILYNKCFYDEKQVPKKYQIQSNYLKVIPIWCENRKKFPLFNIKDIE